MIYMTTYKWPSMTDQSASIDSGFETIDDVVKAMGGGYTYKNSRMVIYGMNDRVCFSDFQFTIKTNQEAPNGS